MKQKWTMCLIGEQISFSTVHYFLQHCKYIYNNAYVTKFMGEWIIYMVLFTSLLYSKIFFLHALRIIFF